MRLGALGIEKVGGVIVTGDLTWRASKEEFDLAKSFLTDVMSWSTLTPNQIILCPGNHDIAFSDEPWLKNKLVPDATPKSKEHFEQFYSDLFAVASNEYLSSGRRFLLARSIPLEVISLNSSYLRQTGGVFQGHGFIGDKQRGQVESEMEWVPVNEKKPRPFRIAILHHHVVPVIPQELAAYEAQSSVVYDAGALSNWLVKHQIGLVLHGHMHHTKVVRESRSLELSATAKWHTFTVAALGSTGVDIKHNTLDGRNVYGLLEFSNDRLRLRVREIHPLDTDRSADPIVDLEIPI